MDISNLNTKAQILVQTLTNQVCQQHGSSSMSTAIYETAWLSMITRRTDLGVLLLFPESFQYILESQAQDGGWETYASTVDGILNTAAALLSIIKFSTTQNSNFSGLDLGPRVALATNRLMIQLQTWDVEKSDHVGFEILVPALLDMLEEYNIKFEFTGRSALQSLRDIKMAKFHPEVLYGPTKTTLLHSLEAFIGKIDFDRIAHHKTHGHFMASPSSTAAYLMNCSAWDREAEVYLRSAITNSIGRGTGSVPCAFPTTIFETTWILSTLLKSHFSNSVLGPYNLNILSEFLKKEFQAHEGIVGFAPLVLADADDTAKTIDTLNLLGDLVSPDKMISTYETATHFQTYGSERTASFSANCNVLSALLNVRDPSCYIKQIGKAASFLCKAWSLGKIQDKWNLSVHYSMMLLTQTLRRLLELWSHGKLSSLPVDLVKEVPLILTQVLIQTLYSQNKDGSWGQSCETSSYALLTLTNSSPFPWSQNMAPKVIESIQKCRQYLASNSMHWGDKNYIWVEKVTYGSGLLSQAYCIAAYNEALDFSNGSHSWSRDLIELTNVNQSAVKKFTRFFSKLPIFSQVPEWAIQASIIEGYQFLPRLNEAKHMVFPRKNMTKDSYLEYIPITWTICNNYSGAFLSNELLLDMMTVSMLNYQVDEFMETAVHDAFKNDLESAKCMIRRITIQSEKKFHGNVNSKPQSVELNQSDAVAIAENLETNEINGINANHDMEKILQNFVSHILSNPKVNPQQNGLARELETFIMAHLDQIHDNRVLGEQNPPDSQPVEVTNFAKSGQTYFDWVHTTSAAHTSCLYSFSYFSCLISAKPSHHGIFSTIQQKYLAQDFRGHLATMCRQYNDLGSVSRDRLEQNLNSINFREFNFCGGIRAEFSSTGSIHADETQRKAALYQMAEYERACMSTAFKELSKTLDDYTKTALQVFVDVTDLYGQIYVARDIASRMR
ncbi:hypothetical protein BELL_0061g00140 [Botrytis elliptica]|uniref:Ent-kaurene synthase n=1 Tax=Botrytis elliptica TaxID=278938 RepID=A0A4Z1K3M0_9HELO|nr:hypothetical protein EAE99_001085 [Botrytis elliptica]TGO78590.1 hypothetical protein BELL_0061g00140 [Botrytis elliptica]